MSAVPHETQLTEGSFSALSPPTLFPHQTHIPLLMFCMNPYNLDKFGKWATCLFFARSRPGGNVWHLSNIASRSYREKIVFLWYRYASHFGRDSLRGLFGFVWRGPVQFKDKVLHSSRKR
jgi:hypothetical protein